jgi:drug/metabolite transporter (DMT)-like permease
MKASRVCQPHSNPDWNIYVVFPFSLLHDSLYGTGGFATGRSRRDTLFGTDMITILSVAILGERVQSYYWIALIIGFAGVLFIVRPGSATFNLGSVFALISVLFYAFSVLITRKLQETDSSATMAYYSSLVYLVFALVLTPLALVIGEIADAHPSIAFLLRGWNTPALVDLVIMCGLGLVWAGGMYFIARAYSTAPASVVAPFEYVSLPINVMWGVVFWHEIPVLATWVGAFLTIGSGLYILHRERQQKLVMQTPDKQLAT